jgi:hypothetical protein
VPEYLIVLHPIPSVNHSILSNYTPNARFRVDSLPSTTLLPTLTTDKVSARLPRYRVLSSCAVGVGHGRTAIRPEAVVEAAVVSDAVLCASTFGDFGGLADGERSRGCEDAGHGRAGSEEGGERYHVEVKSGKECVWLKECMYVENE